MNEKDDFKLKVLHYTILLLCEKVQNYLSIRNHFLTYNEEWLKNWKPSQTNYTRESVQKLQQNVSDKNYFFTINKNFEEKSKTACDNNWRIFTNNETKKKSLRK